MSQLRLGCVPYLNARPLLHGLEAELAVPSELSRRFVSGEFDAALLPIYEALRLPGPRLVDGFGIGCFGPVQSVFVAHRLELERTPEIVLDAASRTSSQLLAVLLRDWLRLPIRLVETSPDPGAARLVIGDRALRLRKDAGWKFFDLGEAWHEWTGLPFVFAMWTLSETAPVGLPERLRAAARGGLAAREEIAAGESDPAEALDYITHSIRYEVGSREREAILRFRRLLRDPEIAAAGEPTFV